MPKKKNKLMLKERLFGLFLLGGGIVAQYNFIQAYNNGGKIGIILTMLAPLMFFAGLILLFDPKSYGSIDKIDGSGDDRILLYMAGLGALGIVINFGFFAYAKWFR